MQHMSDVRLVWQEGGAHLNRKTSNDTSALFIMDELRRADLLVIADSSFSIVPAMLGNMTALAPRCASRFLPHWQRLPCGHERSLQGDKLKLAIGAAIGALAWPPREAVPVVALTGGVQQM